MTENYKHNWKCVSPGMYDTLYQCTICGEKHMESADNIHSDCPEFGCVKKETLTENYEEELKLIDEVICLDATFNQFHSSYIKYAEHFQPAHMRQRIEREMAKDARLAEQEVRIKELEDTLREIIG